MDKVAQFVKLAASQGRTLLHQMKNMHVTMHNATGIRNLLSHVVPEQDKQMLHNIIQNYTSQRYNILNLPGTKTHTISCIAYDKIEELYKSGHKSKDEIINSLQLVNNDIKDAMAAIDFGESMYKKQINNALWYTNIIATPLICKSLVYIIPLSILPAYKYYENYKIRKDINSFLNINIDNLEIYSYSFIIVPTIYAFGSTFGIFAILPFGAAVWYSGIINKIIKAFEKTIIRYSDEYNDFCNQVTNDFDRIQKIQEKIKEMDD